MTTPAKRIVVEVGGREDAATTFARDHLLMLAAAGDGVARARVWRRDAEGLLLGRFHRAAREAGSAREAGADGGVGAGRASAVAREAGAAASPRAGLSRRLTGGRIVPVGPGVVCLTVAAPVVNWFDPAGAALRPDQVLNRALRPLLALLREDGVDAYYPGRDLVTAGGLIVAHASFTVQRDGVAVVEMQVAESASFDRLASLLEALDPDGVAGAAPGALAGSATVVRPGVAARSDEEWAERFARATADAIGGEASVVGAAPAADAALAAGIASTDSVTTAAALAAADFLAEPGPLPEGSLTAASVEMLGVVECAGRMRGDRVTGLRVTGDLIAPFHTIDDIAAECEGEPLRPAYIRKALARVMARPRSFLLGVRDLDEVILRLG